MSELATRSLIIARQYIGKRETDGRNRSPEIDEMVRVGGGLDPEVGYAYCASYVSYCVKKAAAALKMTPLFRTGASVLKLRDRNTKQLIEAPEAGCVFLILYAKDGVLTGQGHCGFVEDVLHDGKLHTLEGNTGPGPAVPKKDREGDGFYERFDRKPGNTASAYWYFIRL